MVIVFTGYYYHKPRGIIYYQYYVPDSKSSPKTEGAYFFGIFCIKINTRHLY